MTHFCRRHGQMIEDAVDLRGLRREEPLVGAFDPLAHAQTALIDHAMHFAGRASIQMFEQQLCPLCFCNAAIQRQGGVDVGDGRRLMSVDGWVDNAADEALDEDVKQKDETPRPVILT